MLSKKYYKKIAEILKHTKTLEHYDKETIKKIQIELEYLFEEDNPRFDIVKFRKAAE